MEAIDVAVVNWTTLSDQEVKRGIEALRRQLVEDFEPVWHVHAKLEFVPAMTGSAVPGHWGLVLLDRNARADTQRRAADAYGSRTAVGHPLARVFLDRLGSGEPWTHLASHELLELLVDPDGTAAVLRPSDSRHRLYAKRVCDPCASYAYGDPACRVSNFVHPAWFGMPGSAEGSFDQLGEIKAPFHVLPGGSIDIVDVEPWELAPEAARTGIVPKMVWPP